MSLSQLIPEMTEEVENTLKVHHIKTSKDVLRCFARYETRVGWSIVTDISQGNLLGFANAADLLRIKGIGYRYIQLLRSVECMTLSELACRNAENLHRQMFNCNLKQEVVLVVPSMSMVKSWITTAKKLPKLITYR